MTLKMLNAFLVVSVGSVLLFFLCTCCVFQAVDGDIWKGFQKAH